MAIDQLEEALFAKLNGTAAVTALVGTTPARIYPQVIPEGDPLPAIVYNRSATDREATRPYGGDSGLTVGTMTVTMHDDTSDGARLLAETVRNVLQDWNGTHGSVVIQNAFMQGESHFHTRDKIPNEPGSFQVNHVYDVWFEETPGN